VRLEAVEEVSRQLGVVILKEKQREAILAFTINHDTFLVLPISYRKSQR
jgi:hypothetical protein